MKTLAATLAFIGSTLIATSANAALMFEDNFDTDTASTTLNFDSLNNWSITDGSVDYIKQGSYGLNCAGAIGGCLDMDGSNNNGGQITSKQTFNFKKGVLYTLTAEVSGNQRNSLSDSITLAISELLTVTYNNIQADMAFQTFTINFGFNNDRSGNIILATGSNDNVGPMIDNVRLVNNLPESTIPEPAPLLLMGAGLAGLSLVRRRKKTFD